MVSLKRRLAENLRSRTGHMMNNLTRMQVTHIEATDYLAIATLLDSRFKDKFFLDPAKLLVAKDGLLALLKDKYDSDFGNADVQVDRTVEVADQRDTQEDVFASMFDQIAKAAAIATPSTVDTPESTLMEYFNAGLEVSNLSSWNRYAEYQPDNKVRKCFVSIAKSFLTPPATSKL